MKRVAIVGAGFAGLALAWHLLQKGERVTIFEAHQIGGGASGIAAGLLHSYVGEQSRKSLYADEGMQATKRLLAVAEKRLGRPVANYEGIIRIPYDDEAIQNLSSYDDVEPLEPGKFLIKSGITVFTTTYLEGLWLACRDLGCQLITQKIMALKELDSFDLVILAMGAGITAFTECHSLKLKLIRGQVLNCKGPSPQKSTIGKGYIALSGKKGVFSLGATYEKNDFTLEANLPFAINELKPKYERLMPGIPFPEVLECKVGFRVTYPQHYIPLIEQIDSSTWVVTAFGSRGLLYHGLMAEKFLSKNEFI